MEVVLPAVFVVVADYIGIVAVVSVGVEVSTARSGADEPAVGIFDRNTIRVG